MESIAVFSQIHKNSNIHMTRLYGTGGHADDVSYIYLNKDGEEIECTAIFIPEMFWKGGYTQMNNETVKDYVMRNNYYLYSDMEYRGIVTKWVKSNQINIGGA